MSGTMPPRGRLMFVLIVAAIVVGIAAGCWVFANLT
jgi:hypothetical protein